jgi:hypothetical protein
MTTTQLQALQSREKARMLLSIARVVRAIATIALPMLLMIIILN